MMLSQWVEWICGAQSLKEWRLLCEFEFTPIEKQTLILKMAQKEVFLMKLKHQLIYHNELNNFVVPNQQKNGDYYVNSCLSQLKNEL